MDQLLERLTDPDLNRRIKAIEDGSVHEVLAALGPFLDKLTAAVIDPAPMPTGRRQQEIVKRWADLREKLRAFEGGGDGHGS